MATPSPTHDKTPLLPTWRQFYSLALIQASTRKIRINWGILEELKRKQAPFVVTCWRSQALYCFFEFKKHRFPLVETSPQIASFIKKLGYCAWQAPELSTSNEMWEAFWEPVKAKPQLWIPADEDPAEEQSLVKIVEWVQKQEIPMIPLGFTTISEPIFPLSTGIKFPYPFSQVVLWVGAPIRVENFPVDQACLMIKQALHQSDGLTRDLLQAIHEK